MGADLYITSIYNENMKKYQKRFSEAIHKRDSLPLGTKPRKEAQKIVEQIYNKMYSKGYFRESYGGPGLMAAYGLSWWQNVAKLQNSRGVIGENGIEQLLDIFKKKISFEDFSSNIQKIVDDYNSGPSRSLPKTLEEFAGEPMKDYYKWVLKRRLEFNKFLKTALEVDGEFRASL